MWNDTKFKVKDINLGTYSISINFFNSSGEWWLTSVYDPLKLADRTNLWNELSLLQPLCLPNWLIAGDFNIYRWELETNAKYFDFRNMASFNNFIQANELIDPPLSYNKFTWSNLRVIPTFSRLDRFLYSEGWENIFKIHSSRTLHRTVSDHFPIVLESPRIIWGPCPFRLNDISLLDKDFKRNFQD